MSSRRPNPTRVPVPGLPRPGWTRPTIPCQAVPVPRFRALCAAFGAVRPCVCNRPHAPWQDARGPRRLCAGGWTGTRGAAPSHANRCPSCTAKLQTGRWVWLAIAPEWEARRRARRSTRPPALRFTPVGMRITSRRPPAAPGPPQTSRCGRNTRPKPPGRWSNWSRPRPRADRRTSGIR